MFYCPSSVINVAHSWRGSCSDTTEIFFVVKVGKKPLILMLDFRQTLGMIMYLAAGDEF